jgi:putative FmdB family regulatory protein
MPIYEYECKKCGAVFEAMQAMSAKPLKTCMGIGCNDKDNGKVTRLISKSGFVLKGSGWYTSDYPSDDRKKGWDEESQQGKPAAPKPDGKEAPATASDAADSSAKTPPPAPAPSPAKPKGPKSPYSGKKKSKAPSKAGKK